MDRREMLKGAAAAMTGITVVNDQLIATGGPFRIGGKPTMTEGELLNCLDVRVWAREFVRLHGGDEGLMQGWFANAMMVGFDEANRQRASAYDPVAVLEAMRERGFGCSLKMNDDIEGWSATWPTRGMSLEGREFPATCTRFNIPDFPSAVRWLHEQAAAADPSFAQAWPVPAEVKQDG